MVHSPEVELAAAGCRFWWQAAHESAMILGAVSAIPKDPLLPVVLSSPLPPEQKAQLLRQLAASYCEYLGSLLQTAAAMGHIH